MASLCYRTDFESTDGDSPAALGNRIAAAIIEYGRDDGALENERYVDSSYTPANEPLLMSESGTVMRDPNRWQPLALEEQIAQNGLPIPGSVQNDHRPPLGSRHIVRHAAVRGRRSRSIPGRRRASATRRPTRRSSRPRSTCSACSSELDPSDGVEIDIGPGALGNNTLGTQRRSRATTSTRQPASRTSRTSCCAPTTPARSPSSGPTGRTRRPRPGTGT